MEIEAAAMRDGAGGPVLALDEIILDLLPAAVYVCDAEGRIVRYNRRAAELWGRTPEPGDPGERFCGSRRLFWPDGRPLPHAETPMAEALRTGRPVQNLEVEMEQPNGRRLQVLVSIAAIRGDDGRITGAVNCFQDVTDRKRDRDALQASELRLRAILEGLPAAIYTTDAAGRITFYNDAAAALWGYPPTLGETVWCGSWRVYRPDGRPLPHHECPMAVAIREGRAVRGEEIVAERPDGSRVAVAAYPTPLRDPDGTLIGAVNMLVDITRHKQAETRQALLINELNHRVKNTLATVQSIATHSLRTAASAKSFRDTFGARLMALSRAHDLLTRRGWEGASLHSVLSQELAPHRSGEADRITLSGPEVELGRRAALTLAMAVHELATNAAKYGALSRNAGRLAIEWAVERDGGGAGPRLDLAWVERDGPPVAAPTRRGFGSRLVARSIEGDLGGEVDLNFAREGLRCRIRIPLDVARGTDAA